jgi:hypothetical protein
MKALFERDGNRRKTLLDLNPLHPGGFFETSRSLSARFNARTEQ